MTSDADQIPRDEAVFSEVEAALGSGVSQVLFRAHHLSKVLGVRLGDGREVVAKVRPAEDRLLGCYWVQRHAWVAGYPAPEPLTPPITFGLWALSIEAHDPGGEMPPADKASPELLAAAFLQLMKSMPTLDDVGPLGSLPWISSQSGGAQLWPRPDDVEVDLNTVEGPQWVDRAAEAARERLARCTAPAVVGHGDWLSQNVRWVDDRVHVVHDWDGAIAEPDLVIVGVTAAVYPVTGGPEETATISQTEAFLRSCANEQGRSWTSGELEVLWAAGLWNRAFDAKKQVTQGRIRTLTENEAHQRMELAGTL